MKHYFADREGVHALGDALIFAGIAYFLSANDVAPLLDAVLGFFAFCAIYSVVRYLFRNDPPPPKPCTMLWCWTCVSAWKIADIPEGDPIPCHLHCAKCGTVLTRVPPNAFRRDPDYWKESGLGSAKTKPDPLAWLVHERESVRPKELDDPDRR